MIRRYYIMPINPGTPRATVDDLAAVFDDCDRFIPGVLDSSAALDLDGKTVVWENTFIDEETYTGPYMRHPYHMDSLDRYLIADSPEAITHDIFTFRFILPDDVPRIEHGIRRIILMKLPDEGDTSVLQKLAAQPEGMASSIFSADNVGWRTPKYVNWTHVWDQRFTDMEALTRYLDSPMGAACSSREGLMRLGAQVLAIDILTCPFSYKPPQSPPDAPDDNLPVLYTVSARLAPEDVDAYVSALTADYDPTLASVGGKLVRRTRSVDRSSSEAEIQSAWEFPSVAAFHEVHMLSFSDPTWNRFVLNAMPLVKGGTRGFHRPI